MKGGRRRSWPLHGGVQRIGEIAVGIGQQDLAASFGVTVVPRDLVENAIGLHFTGIAVVNAGQHAAVEIALGPRGVALDDLVINRADVLPLPFVDLLAGGQSRTVLGTHVPVPPIAAAWGEFDLLFQPLVVAGLERLSIERTMTGPVYGLSAVRCHRR